MEIIPRLTRVAGFEWGTGFYINPVPPEQAAAVSARDEGGPAGEAEASDIAACGEAWQSRFAASGNRRIRSCASASSAAPSIRSIWAI